MATVAQQLARWQVVRDDHVLPDGTLGSIVGVVSADDAWEQRAGTSPHVEFVGEVGAASAADLVMRSAALAGWALRLRFEVLDDKLEMTQHEQRRLPASPGYLLGADTEGNPHVVAEIEDMTKRRPLSSRLLRQVGFGTVADDAKKLLTDEVVVTRFLGPSWQTQQIRPGGVQRSPHHQALWANRYVWALSHDARRPNQFIVGADGKAGVFRTLDEVKQKVTRLRPTYLTRAPASGLAGGELTDKSVALLGELGVEPGSDYLVNDQRQGAQGVSS